MARKRNYLFIWTAASVTGWSDGLIIALAPDARVRPSRRSSSSAARMTSWPRDMRAQTPEVHEVTAGNVVVEYIFGGD